MRVLIACEESQTVCKAFRKLGHEAYSCDIQECSGGHPEWHYKEDVFDVIDKGWDLIIMHPPCTAMAVSGNRWYGRNMPMHNKRIEAVEWTKKLWDKACSVCKKVVMENPVSVLFSNIVADTIQYIQPWMFGHGETKKTGLALKGLPELEPTNLVEGREQRIWKMPPSPDRAKLRSVTFQGIADAMAQQWGIEK